MNARVGAPCRSRSAARGGSYRKIEAADPIALSSAPESPATGNTGHAEEALMPIRRYRKDPRSEPQRRADEAALASFERGNLLRVPPAIERAAIDFVTKRHTELRRPVTRRSSPKRPR